MAHELDSSHALAVLITDTHLTENTATLFNEVMVAAADLALASKVKVYHLGDMFNSRKAQPLSCLLEMQSILDYYQQLGVELVSLVGNHDKIDHRSEESFLTAFSNHPALSLVSEFDYELISKQIEDQDQNFVLYMMSYFDLDLQLEFIQKIKEIDPLIYQEVGAHQNILLTHADIVGGKQQGGNMSTKGLRVDDLLLFRYVLSGHYHDRSEVGHCHYIGASHQHNFGEDNKKGLCLLVWDSAEHDFGMISVKIPTVRQLSRVMVPARDLTSIHEISKAQIERGDRIQLIISVNEQDRADLTVELERLDRLGYEIIIESDTGLVISQTKEENETKTILELFDQFCQDQGLDPELAKSYLK